jgi:steroid delta-isomerase-like uncharacterized protein
MATTQKRQHDVAARISDVFVEAYNTGDTAGIVDVVTPDFVCHHMPSGREFHGSAEYRDHIGETRAAFPDFSLASDELVVEGEMGAGRYRWTGTHEGEFNGIPATDRRVDTSSMTMMRMDGDRLAEMWIYGDDRGMMEQLGIER